MREKSWAICQSGFQGSSKIHAFPCLVHCKTHILVSVLSTVTLDTVHGVIWKAEPCVKHSGEEGYAGVYNDTVLKGGQ
jgi:hypothetical protein